MVAHYEYDAWGNLLSITDADGNVITDQTNIANLNPFRYRGYYYDTELGMYYLQSRYYDPELGRFINADGQLNTDSFNGCNLFAYCENDPVNLIDPHGTCPYNGTVADFHRLEQGLPSLDCTCKKRSAVAVVDYKKDPPDHPDFKSPKKGNKKVKNPNGKGYGWQAKDGGVWVWTPKMHGDPGWTVQYPGGGHSHAYPDGGVRNHFQAEQSTTDSVIMIFVGGVVTVGLIADDVLGVGVVDDPLIAGSAACFIGGLNGLLGKKVCTECGEIMYGY